MWYFLFLVNGIIPYSQLESPKLEKPPCSCLTCSGAAPAGNPGNTRSCSRLLPPWLWMWKSCERLWAPPLCDLPKNTPKPNTVQAGKCPEGEVFQVGQALTLEAAPGSAIPEGFDQKIPWDGTIFIPFIFLVLFYWVGIYRILGILAEWGFALC